MALILKSCKRLLFGDDFGFVVFHELQVDFESEIALDFEFFEEVFSGLLLGEFLRG
jgi:hypothetical protein